MDTEKVACACHNCNPCADVSEFRHYYPECRESAGPILDPAAFIAGLQGPPRLVEGSILYVQGEGWAVTGWVWDSMEPGAGKRVGMFAFGGFDSENEADSAVLEFNALLRDLSQYREAGRRVLIHYQTY